MSVVRFAEICDKCGKRSEEYSGWNTCTSCGDDICTDCDVAEHRDDEGKITSCKQCEGNND